MTFAHGRPCQKQRALRQAAAGLVHTDRRQIRSGRHRGDRQILTEIQMRAMCLIRQNLHAMRVRQLHDFRQIRADAIVSRVIHQNRAGIRILADRLVHLLHTHTKRNAKPLIHLRIHIYRMRAAQNHGVDDTAVYIAGQNNLVISSADA